MSSQEFAGTAPRAEAQERVVEYELKMPKLEDIKLPEVDLKPAADVAKKVLLVGLGAGVLLVRGVVKVVQAAAEAGADEIEHPGPVTQAVMRVVKRPEESTEADTKPLRVPVLAIDGYDTLESKEVIARLAGLSAEQLNVIRQHEITTKNREEIIAALDELLGLE